MREKVTTWLFIFLLAGVVIGVIDRAYYSFVFLPDFHGSFEESIKIIVNVNGFIAYVKTVPGALLSGATFSSFAAAGVCFVISKRNQPDG